MGKGDKKTKRGKIIIGSYGVRRPSRSRKTNPVVAVKVKAEKKVEKEVVEKVKAEKKVENVVAETTEKKAAKKPAAKKPKKETKESAE